MSSNPRVTMTLVLRLRVLLDGMWTLIYICPNDPSNSVNSGTKKRKSPGVENGNHRGHVVVCKFGCRHFASRRMIVCGIFYVFSSTGWFVSPVSVAYFYWMSTPERLFLKIFRERATFSAQIVFVEGRFFLCSISDTIRVTIRILLTKSYLMWTPERSTPERY